MCIDGDDFTLEPYLIKTFTFSFPALTSSVGSKIEVCYMTTLFVCPHLPPSLPPSAGSCYSSLVEVY